MFRMGRTDWTGIEAIIGLVRSGAELEDICDSYGRALVPEAEPFFAYHRQAKRLWLKWALGDSGLKAQLCEGT